MPPSSQKSLLKLPQRRETWHLAVRKLRMWITPPDEEPYRPYAALIINLNKNLVQGAETYETFPTAEQLWNTLFEAMRKRAPGSYLKPHRPRQIHFEEENLVDVLAPALKAIGVSARHQDAKKRVNKILAEMEQHMRGDQPESPGLLSQKDVTAEFIGDLFNAAAHYYRAAPWIYLTNMQTLAIRVDPYTTPWYVVVMGNAGMEYGLALYKQWEDFEQMIGIADNVLERIPHGGAHNLIFDDITLVPFEDLDAIEEHGWEVVDERSYPIPMVYPRVGSVKRPNFAELFWYEAAMRAIPLFVSDHLKSDDQGGYHPAKAEFTVSTYKGETKVEIEYPAGELSVELYPVDAMGMGEYEDADDTSDFPVGFDLRSMEGSLPSFGGGFDDPKENQAQETMYEAWDEKNPAKRINLAYKALTISPNCADAYVLLAEEEADTLARAFAYYQKGVKAGEHALGKAYFEENEGYFWGLLETRPYMRAREGMINTLWDMGHKGEALEHCRDMLRLNPGDNQGIRHSLLTLLLELDRGDEVDALLQEYEEDWTSEWLYTRALRAFIKSGQTQTAQKALQDALEQNAYVPEYLTGRKRIPNRLPEFISLGRDSEAVGYAYSHLNFWRKTAGAVKWLQEQVYPSDQKRTKKSKPKKITKRGRRSKKS